MYNTYFLNTSESTLTKLVIQIYSRAYACFAFKFIYQRLIRKHVCFEQIYFGLKYEWEDFRLSFFFDADRNRAVIDLRILNRNFLRVIYLSLSDIVR